MVIIEHFLFKKLRYQFHSIEKSHKKFLAIENYLRLNSKWPPLSLYNKNENNSPNDENGPNSGSSKVGHSDKDDEDDAASPLSYAEISIEANDDGVVFDRNSSILNSFFERERLKAQKSMDEADSNVFQENPLTIRQKTQMLKREYLELQLNETTAPTKPKMNGYGQAEHNVDHIDGQDATLVEKF